MVLVTPKDLIVRCLFRCQLFFESDINCFVFIGSHGIFQGPALETVIIIIIIIIIIICVTFVKNLLNRNILGLLRLKNFILYFLDPLWYPSRF